MGRHRRENDPVGIDGLAAPVTWKGYDHIPDLPWNTDMQEKLPAKRTWAGTVAAVVVLGLALGLFRKKHR